MINFILESAKQALRALAFNKVRSALTMLGVIIGIFSVITLVTIGEGAKTYVTNQIKNLGVGYDSFIVIGGEDPHAPPVAKFILSDITYLKSRIPEIKDVMALNPSTGDLYYGNKKKKSPVIIGTSANMLDLMGGELEAGRFFSVAEVDARKHVVVLGPSVAKDVFGSASPLGERIKLRGKQYTIIGVLQAVGSIGPVDMDRRAVVPITTAQNMMGTSKIIRLNVFVHDVKKMDLAREKVRELLIRRTGGEDFRLMTQQGLLNIITNILTALTGFVTGIAAISLLVGGIGIMNIMLVAVNERVREIGVRKAIGAKSRDIILQFLVEATLISLIGGILGIILGIAGAFLILWFIKGTFVVAWWAVILATVFSAMVGIFFGVYPAVRAARLDPVIALRYE